MKNKHRSKSRKRKFLRIIFLCSLVFCLWLLQLRVVTAQNSNSQLVQQGIERYKAGDFQESIAIWQTALNAYK